MVLGKIIDYIIGKALFEIYLTDPRQTAVLNLLKKNGFYDCRVTGEKISLSCSCSDARVIQKELVDMDIKYTMRIFGLSHTLSLLKYRIGLPVAVVLCFVMHFLFTGILWKINVVGNEEVPEKEIRSQLYSLGIREGSVIRNINIPKLTMEYMLRDDRFSFVHLNINGTSGTFKVAERVKPPKTPDKKEVCNIVAKCDGIIERLDVYSGGREVENGQTVVKGQLLISSFFETRLSGHLLKRAKGTALAKTFPVYEMHIPKKYIKENGNTRLFEKRYFSVLGISVPIDGLNVSLDTKSFDTETVKKRLTLFGYIDTPVFLCTEKYTVNETEEKKRTQENARALFDKSYMQWKKQLAEKAEILDENISVSETDEAFVFTAKLCAVENIGVEIPFEISETP